MWRMFDMQRESTTTDLQQQLDRVKRTCDRLDGGGQDRGSTPQW